MMEDTEVKSVRVYFTTTDQDLQLPEGSKHISVPADIKRYGLSRILNSESMLATPSPIPLDFLINGVFLRTSLADFLVSSGLSDENTITLTYVRALVPPSFDKSFEHPDWVSSVDLLSATSHAAAWWPSKYNNTERVVSGSHDGLLRIWTPEGRCIATSPGKGAAGGHTMAVTSARFLSPTQILSAGLDRVVRMWKYTEDISVPDAPTGLFKPIIELRGHMAAIRSLAVHGATSRVLSASDDGHIGLWTSSKDSAPALAADDPSLGGATHKRRKISSTPTSGSTAVRGALSLQKHHAGPATAVFDARDATVGYSGGSTDHAVRTLDLMTNRAVSSVSLTADITALCSLAGALAPAVAAGTAGRTITLVDPREDGSSRTSVLTLRGHTNRISALVQAPDSEYALASSSLDGAVMVWDLRASGSSTADNEAGGAPSTKPVYVIDRESLQGKKRPVAGQGCGVFDLKWDKTWGIVSGGEDRKVQVNRSQVLR